MDTRTQLILIGYITTMLICGRLLHHYTKDDAYEPFHPIPLFCLSLLWPLTAAVLAALLIIALFTWAATGTKPWK